VADVCVGLQDIIDRVEVLPYHTLGVDKYEALGRKYPLLNTPTPSQESIDAAVAIFRERGLYTIV
jgi:pyruvate formate lyase activating enzyme